MVKGAGSAQKQRQAGQGASVHFHQCPGFECGPTWAAAVAMPTSDLCTLSCWWRLAQWQGKLVQLNVHTAQTGMAGSRAWETSNQ